VALNSTPLAPKYKLLEAEVPRYHLAPLSRGNIVLFLQTMMLTWAPLYYSAYTDSTPGIKWNVSDIPTLLGRRYWANSSLSVPDL